MLNPAAQYSTDRNLRSRQHLWDYLTPPFDLTGWVVELLDLRAGETVLDAGCGNGRYLHPMQARGARVVGCDLSRGMLESMSDRAVVAADVTRLPFETKAFDRVLAAHMLYHVKDRPSAVKELRRVLSVGGVCVAVTNGEAHTASIRALIERAVQRSEPGWKISETPLRQAFSLENGAQQMCLAFDEVQVVRPLHARTAIVRDPEVIADYVASIGDHYGAGLSCSWTDVVDEVRSAVLSIIETEGSFSTMSDAGALVCR